MMAGFAAAYMSTVGTQLNWGASYLVNDFYKRFVNKTASEKHYVVVSRVGDGAPVPRVDRRHVAARIRSRARGSSCSRSGAGTGLVLILRWYWWRINAWSEISAMIASFVVSVTAHSR